MKTITKFLTLVLSLFCVFGLVSPVYAEGVQDLELKEYKIIRSDETSSSNLSDYYIEVGKKYTFSWLLQGESNLKLDDLINEYPDKLSCDILSVDKGPAGSDLTDDPNQSLYGVDAFITPVKEGVVTLDVGSGKKVTFHVHEEDYYNAPAKIEKIFLEKCKSLYVSSDSDDPLPEMNQFMKEAIAEVGLTENDATYSIEYDGSDVGKVYYYAIEVDGAGLDALVTIPWKEQTNVTPDVAEGTPSTTVQSDADKIVENTKASYSKEQQETLTAGGSAEVKVSVSTTTPSDADKKLVEAQLNSTNKVAMYLDLGVKVSIKTKEGIVVGEDVTVSETGTPVKFTVALDDSLINTKNTVDRTYQVVRIHNGVVDVLPATFDADSKTITFETDKFSTYAVMYTDTPKASKTPATADGMNATLYGGVAVISVLAVGLLFFFKKRNA